MKFQHAILAIVSSAAPTNAQAKSSGCKGMLQGPHVAMGPTDIGQAKTGSSLPSHYIVRAESIYTPGEPPKGATAGVLFLWPGINDQAKRTSGDLIQTVFDGSTRKYRCSGETPWCVAPVVMHGVGIPDWDKGIPVSSDAKINITYHLNEARDTWVQTTTDTTTGKQLHNFVRGKLTSNYPRGWGTGTELQGGHPGTVSTQTYSKTIITLNKPNPNFGKTHSAAAYTQQRSNVTPKSSGAYTKDGGLTWHIDEISIPPWAPRCG